MGGGKGDIAGGSEWTNKQRVLSTEKVRRLLHVVTGVPDDFDLGESQEANP